MRLNFFCYWYYNGVMKDLQYFKNIFDRNIQEIIEEELVDKKKVKIASVTEWAQWLLKKKHIDSHTFTIFQERLKLLSTSGTNNYSNRLESKSQKTKRSYLFIYLILFILTVLVSFNLYTLFRSTDVKNVLFGNEAKGRVLPFKGSIELKSGEPLSSKRDIVFRLYSDANSGSPLYSGACVGENGIQPQYNGSFTIIIGSDCNMSVIPESIFSNNKTLYLGVTVGTDKELTPRYMILTESFSSVGGSAALQGKTVGTETSSIPFLDEKGSLRIDAESPSIISTSGVFTIEGAAVSIQATEAVKGNILLKPGEQSNVVIESGRLGIGDFTPDYLLSAESNQPYSTIGSIRNLSSIDDEKSSALRIALGTPVDGSASSFIEFYAGATSTEQGSKVGGIRLNNEGVVFESNGADFAEYFNITYIDKERSPLTYVPGMILSIGEKGISLAVPGEKIIGAISDDAGFIGNMKEKESSELVALVGQVKVLVSTVGGDIKRGDKVGASSIPGFGSKVSANNFGVGYALEPTDEVALSNETCPQRSRKLKDSNGKRVKCGRINVIIDLD